MKTISIGLEWGSYPIQELDSKGYIIDDISAEELGMDSEFCGKIQKLQNMYDDLFVNNEKEFSYIGNKKPEEIKKIKEIYSDVVKELLNKLNNKFNIKILDLDIQIEIEPARNESCKLYFSIPLSKDSLIKTLMQSLWKYL